MAAFGIPEEIEPGVLHIRDETVVGVHLTRLQADGYGKAGTAADKIMIGRSIGMPIVLAPTNDTLGLAVVEGIEDALSIFEATGLGGLGCRLSFPPSSPCLHCSSICPRADRG